MAEAVNTVGDQSGQSTSPEGHNQAMIDKVDQIDTTLQQQQQTPQTSGPILGKFSSVDDLAAAYKALEQKLGQQGTPQGEQQSPPQTGPLSEERMDELVEAAGVDIDAMAEHYLENRGLTDEHYAELEKAGISRDNVDQYIRGVEAEASQKREALMGELGGEETFTAMVSWAKANMSPAEVQAYNDTIDEGDDYAVRSAVMGLAYRYQKAVGSDPQLLNGNGTGGGGYESIAQLTEAMKDARYHKDPAYRKEVEQKLARSNIF